MSEGGEQGQVESSLEIWSLRGLVIETDEEPRSEQKGTWV